MDLSFINALVKQHLHGSLFHTDKSVFKNLCLLNEKQSRQKRKPAESPILIVETETLVALNIDVWFSGL